MKRKAAKNKTEGLVYSTGHGRTCPACGQPQSGCSCRQEIPAAGDGIVRVGRETKGRKGKGVTLVAGVRLDRDGLRQLARQLKQLCGSGGTLKNGVIEIQGDHREKLIEELTRQGWKVKRAGG